MPPRVLKDLRIDEISSVDRGAGERVRVRLLKRSMPWWPAFCKSIEGLDGEVLAYCKREFTAEQRQSSEDKGHAMEGGGYPIENVEDLKNAIQAIGRAKDAAATKAHIRGQARRLGRTDLIPDDWSKRWPVLMAPLPGDDLAKYWSDAAREAAAWARRQGRTNDDGSPTQRPSKDVPGMSEPAVRQLKGELSHMNNDQLSRYAAIWAKAKAGTNADYVHAIHGLATAEMQRRGISKKWSTNADLPDSIRNNLPDEAQSVWRKVANDRMDGGASEQSAIKQAWTAVKNGWKKQGDEWVRKYDFDTTIAASEATEDASGFLGDVYEACQALNAAICSISQDDDVDDPAAAIKESIQQFKDYVSSLPESGDDDDGDDGDTVGKTESGDMTTPNLTASSEVKKLIDAAVHKALAGKDDEIAKLRHELTISKMSDKHKAYHDNLSSDDAKKKFVAMSPNERDAEMDRTKKRAEEDPIFKQLMTQNSELMKRLQQLEDDKELAIAKADAKERGWLEADAGEVLMKARRGDKEAMQKVEDFMKRQNKQLQEAQKSGKIFTEFGSSQGGGKETGATAYDELTAKADELRKADPNLTEAQAFAKVVDNPANRELVARERQERLIKLQNRVAA